MLSRLHLPSFCHGVKNKICPHINKMQHDANANQFQNMPLWFGKYSGNSLWGRGKWRRMGRESTNISERIPGFRGTFEPIFGRPEHGGKHGKPAKKNPAGRRDQFSRQVGTDYRRPSSFFASSFSRPPILGWGRPKLVTTRATTISSAMGASSIRTDMASKWVLTKAASL